MAFPEGLHQEAQNPVTHSHLLAENAYADAISRAGGEERVSPEARERIAAGISERLLPALIESGIIAEQRENPAYVASGKAVKADHGHAIEGFHRCPDGRVLSDFSINDPNIATPHQRLAGRPEIRKSTSRRGLLTLDAPEIRAALINDAADARRDGYTPKSIQGMGVHVFSTDPEYGCGALKLEIGSERMSQFGGIQEFYESLGESGFPAFDNYAATLGIESATLEFSHDAYSQGLISGIRTAYPQFSHARTLRENLEDMHNRRRIVMTELLDPTFAGRILELDSRLFRGQDILDPFNPHAYAMNMTRLNIVALEIARQEENNGFAFIPEHLTDGIFLEAQRALAFSLIRNIAYRTLADIQPGHHSLIRHNERWIYIGLGSSGPGNVEHVPFALRAPNGHLTETDRRSSYDLEGILRKSLLHIGVTPDHEAVILVIGQRFDPSIYASPERAQWERQKAISLVDNEAARIRNEREQDIIDGRIVVLGALAGPQRTLTDFVK